ncbi:uncharacterized protein TA16735 [Theileria annulata]|uniref:Uncharacterized protein n=1 Tax=Theileria annulata TaxID=5874 RepID=Q4UII5_THEAN|nr:uncharacterized protein TA16735 [Theileria annulata]CAI73104.1 hypothetical protein TA16735 [Theileria annulata]|eukprot:XP_953782.1 hypothetical protein TA16735 [Theileria annulata]
MKKRVPDAGDFLESYFLGLSCLVCSEQFYILISQTKASPNFQWYLLLSTSFVTLTLVLILYNKTYHDFINLVHYYYLYLPALLICFVWLKVTSVLITTCTTIGIGFLTTFLIIEACVHYSSNAKFLLAFVAGLLSARILPSFCWILIAKYDYESQSRSVSLILSIARFSFCLISLCIKFMKGGLSFDQVKSIEFKSDQFSFDLCTKVFTQLYEFYSRRITNDLFNENGNNKIYLTILNYLMHFSPIFCFFFSIIFFLPLSPVMDAHLNRNSNFIYAPHVIRSLSRLEIACHLLGFYIGILFPASYSENLAFCFINIFNISIRFIIEGCFSFFLKNFPNIGIYLMVIIYSTLNGYVCSYNLFVIIRNTFHNCKNKEYNEFVCCGDEFLTQCYCRYPAILNERNEYYCSRTDLCTSKLKVNLVKKGSINITVNLTFSIVSFNLNRFSCSKSFTEHNSLEYSLSGSNAILLVQKGEKTEINEICSQVKCDGKCCQNPCKTEKCGCLRLCGIYEIETVTTSTCDDCQLTVRIEGKNCNQCSDCAGSGSTGTCSCSVTGSNCCCICVKCCRCNSCNPPCNGCTKLCCCENCKKLVKSNRTRVFLFFKTFNQKCFIREISPVNTPNFERNRKQLTEFYIDSIFILDCCHSDIQVDLHCRFCEDLLRITPVQYPRKWDNPKVIKLCKNIKQCCEKKPEGQCCCTNVLLQRVIVGYSSKTEKSEYEKCKCPASLASCSCCLTGKCCCCICAELKITPENSFDTTMKPVKIKLISIFWILFFLILIFTYLIMSSVKVKELKYYDFNPVTSYETIKEKIKRNKLNSADGVKHRIDGFLMNSGLESKEYDSQLEHMIKLFECTFDPINFTFLRNHLEEVSFKLLNDPVFILKTKIEMIKWSCCLGLIYTYVMEMFIRIQIFFVNWEYVWEKEYKYYRMKMSNRINQITYESKFGVAGLSEYGIGLKAYMSIAKSRKDTWSSALYNLENYLDLYEGEIEFKEKQFPESLDERLQHYIDMWNNRIGHLEEWIDTEIIFFDWTIFLEDFPSIKTWVNMFGKYVQGAFDEVVFDEKKFNKGTKIFLIDKIK